MNSLQIAEDLRVELGQKWIDFWLQLLPDDARQGTEELWASMWFAFPSESCMLRHHYVIRGIGLCEID